MDEEPIGERIDRLLALLPPRTVSMLTMRYGTDPTMTLYDIAAMHGVCVGRVRQIIAKGIRLLRRHGIDLREQYDVRGKRRTVNG